MILELGYIPCIPTLFLPNWDTLRFFEHCFARFSASWLASHGEISTETCQVQYRLVQLAAWWPSRKICKDWWWTDDEDDDELMI
jgi:hypothetical protein